MWGWGAVLTGRFCTPLYSYKHEMKPRGESWLKAHGNVRGRFGRGWHATLGTEALVLDYV